MLSRDAGAAVGAVDVVLEDLQQLSSTIDGYRSDLHGQVRSFAGFTPPAGMFGHNAAGRGLAAVHGEAHAVFSATVAGIVQDLAEFRQRLLADKANYEHHDETAEQAIRAIGAPVHGPSHADQAERAAARRLQHRPTSPGSLATPTPPAPDGPTVAGATQPPATPDAPAPSTVAHPVGT